MHGEKCPVCDGRGEKHCCDNKGWIEVSDSDKQKEFIPYPMPMPYPEPFYPIYPYWEVRPWELPTYTTGGNELFYSGSTIETQSEIIFQ